MKALARDWLPRQYKNETYESGVYYTGTYDLSSHVVATEDNYYLKLFRLIPANANKTDFSRPAIFLQHGLMGSSESWIGS